MDGETHWEVSSFRETPSKVALVCVRGEVPQLLEQLRNVPLLQDLPAEALSIRLFYNATKVQGNTSFSSH